ncbi:MAG: R3H domain-containing nucleic acid-binding protein [bacterium]
MDAEKAKKIIEDTLALMGVVVESVQYAHDEKRGHTFSILSADFENLARGRDDYYKDFVFVMKRIFNKDAKPGDDLFKCTIDINNQQSEADNRIKMKALNAAEQATSLKTDVEMDPMSSYERMVVHSVLAGKPDISTESIGEGKTRRVVVKYLAI